ncbi:MAG: exopolyphosphatase [Candidatus Latescibacteria bacterium]|nr:exopolyphosphatase [Candidatus Latescibacterota bacterium]
MRLLTRSDFDGLVCAVLLEEKGLVNDYLFVHPKDVQEGKIKATADDVLANIPYIPGCGLWFDHHMSESERLDLASLTFEGEIRSAPSAAQVIWDYYGGEKTFKAELLPLLDAVNRSDSGNLTREEVLEPKGYILLSYIMDPRTGLGRFKDFKISNYQLMIDMIKYCRTKPVEEILEISDVRERTDRYFEHQEPFKEMLKNSSEVHGNVIVTNFMDIDTIYCGNRFMIYALYPDQNIEIRVMWGREKEKVVFTVGHSILNRTSKTDVGKLMLNYGGGGHEKVGTCQVITDYWEEVLDELIEKTREDT